MWINLSVQTLNFHDFSLISNIFITIHEYANLIICISVHWMKVLCLYIQLVPKIVSKYDQEIPQSQTADNPVAPRGRAAQPSRDTRKTN